MLPQTGWGFTVLTGIALPIVAASVWPVHSGFAWLLLCVAIVAAASGTLCTCGGIILLFGRNARRGLLLSSTGTICYWIFATSRAAMAAGFGNANSLLRSSAYTGMIAVFSSFVLWKLYRFVAVVQSGGSIG